jgi:DNA-binding NarL/FixJ family response regulator
VRILVVDESAAVRERLSSRLRDAGHAIAGDAATAAAALELTLSLTPDAIILDVLLSDRTGVTIVSSLRAASATLIIGIVTNAPEYRRHCLAAGADFVLDKSTEFDAMATALVSAASRMKLQPSH